MLPNRIFLKIDNDLFNLPAEKIRHWLAAPDSSKNKNEARDKRQADTCAWFLEGERFRMWQENPGFLWVKGKRKFHVHQI